jgi:hypothetical protein
MSSETDHPRQRTVAELLAAHGGDGNVSGRRRRRRADEPDEEAYDAPAGDPSDQRSAPPREPRRAAPDNVAPPAQHEPGGRRRAGGASGRPADQRAPEQRPADPWGADEPGADDWASEQWDAGPWDDEGRRDAGRRETPSREARPPLEPWDGPVREARYAEPEPQEPAPRRARRAAEDLDPAGRDAPPWESREPAPSWEAREEPRRPRVREEPRPPREPEEPAWEPRAAEPEPNGRPRTRDLRSLGRQSWGAPEPEAPPRAVGSPRDERARAAPIRDVPTDKMPHVGGAGSADPAVTSRIQQQRRRPEPEPDEFDDDDGGPATMVGAPPAGSEAWHRSRTDGRRRPPGPDDEFDDDDGGPATMAGAPPAGAEAWRGARTGAMRRGDDGGPPTQAGAPLSFDEDDEDDDADYPAGLGGRDMGEEPTGIFAAGAAPDAPVKRRSAQTEAKEEAGGGQAWAAVIAQWIAGAIGGAALWVGFRFLWRDLPVVAIAAAVLVTVGLVVVVRALLRSSDLRTTLFAVLVGLLLTVSPAILVLLGR